MVAVMFVGVAVLYLRIEGALGAMDTSTTQLQSDAAAAALLAMALSMNANYAARFSPATGSCSSKAVLLAGVHGHRQ
jgi:hypothetical protein